MRGLGREESFQCSAAMMEKKGLMGGVRILTGSLDDWEMRRENWSTLRGKSGARWA